MATPDDLAALISAQTGSHGVDSRWNDFSRGIATVTNGPDDAADELGLSPVNSNSTSWTQETVFHTYIQPTEQPTAEPSDCSRTLLQQRVYMPHS